MAAAKRADWLFGLWFAAGAALVAASWFCEYRCPDVHFADRTFRFMNQNPEAQARYAEYDRWVARLNLLKNIGVGYGVLGAVAFRRRGCATFAVAGIVAFLCLLSWLNATWVPL